MCAHTLVYWKLWKNVHSKMVLVVMVGNAPGLPWVGVDILPCMLRSSGESQGPDPGWPRELRKQGARRAASGRGSWGAERLSGAPTCLLGDREKVESSRPRHYGSRRPTNRPHWRWASPKSAAHGSSRSGLAETRRTMALLGLTLSRNPKSQRKIEEKKFLKDKRTKVLLH